MSKIGAWCEVCKSRTHDTKDCWGPGTVCVGNTPNPIWTPAMLQVPTNLPAMSPELRAAIDQVTGGIGASPAHKEVPAGLPPQGGE